MADERNVNIILAFEDQDGEKALALAGGEYFIYLSRFDDFGNKWWETERYLEGEEVCLVEALLKTGGSRDESQHPGNPSRALRIEEAARELLDQAAYAGPYFEALIKALDEEKP